MLVFALLGPGLGPVGIASADRSPELVYMQQVRPVTITPQWVTVDSNGEGSVIVVIGETSIPRPDRFRLGAARLATLHRLLSQADLAQLHIEAPIPVRKFMYTVRAGGHSVRVVEGAIPAQLRPLIAFLHGLISRYGGTF